MQSAQENNNTNTPNKIRYLFPLTATLIFGIGYYIFPAWVIYPWLSTKYGGAGYLMVSMAVYLLVLGGLSLAAGSMVYVEGNTHWAQRFALLERGPGQAGMDWMFAILSTVSAAVLGYLCGYSSWAFFLMPAAIAISVSFWLLAVSGNHELWPAASYTRLFPDVFPPPVFETPDPQQTPGESRTLSWMFLRGGVQEIPHKWNVFLPEAEIALARSSNPGNNVRKLYADMDALSKFAHLCTNPASNTFLVKLAEKLHQEAMENEYSLYEELCNVLACVQSIPYKTDEESTGQEEYWKFPVETLADGCGDCEDKALLMCALCMLLFQAYPENMKEHRLEVYLLVSFEEEHAAVAVGGPNVHLPERFYTYNGRRLYFCETTNNGRVGAVPEGVDPKKFITIPMSMLRWETPEKSMS